MTDGPRLRAMADLATPMSIRVGATLDVADHVAAGAATAAAVADRCGAHAPALERLLLHWAWLGLLHRDADGTYSLTELGAELRSDHPAGRRDWLDIRGSVGRGDLAFVELLHTVTTGGSAYRARYGHGFWDDLAADAGLRASFDALMQRHVADDAARIADAYPWSAHRVVVDVAGGNGTLLARILRANPGLAGIVVELDEPAARARETFAAEDLRDRADVVVGSFFEPLPARGDAYVLSAVLHDWDDDACRRILRICRSAMTETDRLLVVEAVGPDGESVDPRMDLRMLAYTGGRERGVTELESLAAAAGLERVRTHPVPGSRYMAVVELRPTGRQDP
ncbi:methyltransferase [Isoptericola sp. 178]|uniref:methyltransferase n=1 Tax=Isoptericola sp. 178 TaxID=3064651 RepID=UPI0027128BF2|nr:methyltransferase [Isoptericola sp. 178]MDO8145893.1 methyltransferase [Isoptericola sp. 178]